MILFLIMADGENDAFVWALSSEDALAHWRLVYLGKCDPECPLEIVEVPTAPAAAGVVPWDTLKIIDHPGNPTDESDDGEETDAET